METKNRVKLVIADCDIYVASEDTEEYIRETGARVDEHIRNLKNKSPTMSTTLAAILAALDFCDEATKEREAADNLRSQIKECLDETAKLRAELEAAKKREEEAQQQLKALKALNGLKALEENRKLNENKT